MLNLIGNITIAVLCSGQFAVYAGVSLDLAMQLTALFQIGLAIGISIPDLTAVISLAVNLTIGINAAITLGLPSLAVSIGVQLSATLTIVLGLIASLEAVLAVGGASLDAFTYVGAGAGTFGAAATSALASQWPDGTPASETVDALLLVATSTGFVPASEVQSVSILPQAHTGTGAPPTGGQGFERGLCSVTLGAPPAGGTQATASPVISSGTITGITVTNAGAGYLYAPSAIISDTVSVTGASNASPIVLTLPLTTDITAVTVAGVTGNTAANGQWCAKVLTSSTIALYKDSAFTIPSVGNAPWLGGGTVTGSGVGAAALAVMGGGAIAQLGGFMSGLTFPPSGLGSGLVITLANICPLTFSLLADLGGHLQLQAKLLASASAHIGLIPPMISGNLGIVAGIDANATAALRFVPPLPSIQASLSAAISAQAALIGSLVAKIGVQLGFATETLGVYTYSGPGSGLGAAITAGVPSTSCSAVILGATSPASQAALDVFFPAAA